MNKIIIEKNSINQLPFDSLDAIPLPVLVSESIKSSHDQAPRVHLYINHAFVDQIGYTLEEMPDINAWFNLAYPEVSYRSEVVKGWAQVVEQSKQRGDALAKMTALVHCKNNQKKWFTVVANINAEQLHIVTFLDIHDLKCEIDESTRLSLTDYLTKLSNRRKALTFLDHQLQVFKRTSKPFSVVLCDVDYFKRINDTHGHPCGDRVLCALADALKNACREVDCVARWGGEEFLIVLTGTDRSATLKFAERLRYTVERINHLNDEGDLLAVTMSFGCATITDNDTLETLLKNADEALYKAKTGNRNQVCG